MMRSIVRQKKSWPFRVLSSLTLIPFLGTLILPPQLVSAQQLPGTVLNLPLPGSKVLQSNPYLPAVIKGLTIHPDNPLRFDFIVDSGDSQLTGSALADESNKLIRYFLAAITTPEKELWVNLSPYEKDRIVPARFGETEMGRDLLAQDYLLKQLMASLIYPEDNLGKEFWDRVYAQAKKQYGTTNIPINTFNKVWIVPDDAVVLEYQGSAFVVKSHLKVMLEEDYLALEKNLDNAQLGTSKLRSDSVKDLSGISSKVVKEILIPEIEKEVNQGKHFANLRQIYNAVILATWYKGNLKNSLLSRVYADKNKIKGVDVDDKAIKEKIYEQYLAAFKKGVYNYIRKDIDPATQEVVPRKYFSGGVQLSSAVKTLRMQSPADLSTLPAYVQEAFNSSSPIVRMTADMMENQGPATAVEIASAVNGSVPILDKKALDELGSLLLNPETPVYKKGEALARLESLAGVIKTNPGLLEKVRDILYAAYIPQENKVIGTDLVRIMMKLGLFPGGTLVNRVNQLLEVLTKTPQVIKLDRIPVKNKEGIADGKLVIRHGENTISLEVLNPQQGSVEILFSPGSALLPGVKVVQSIDLTGISWQPQTPAQVFVAAQAILKRVSDQLAASSPILADAAEIAEGLKKDLGEVTDLQGNISGVTRREESDPIFPGIRDLIYSVPGYTLSVMGAIGEVSISRPNPREADRPWVVSYQLPQEVLRDLGQGQATEEAKTLLGLLAAKLTSHIRVLNFTLQARWGQVKIAELAKEFAEIEKEANAAKEDIFIGEAWIEALLTVATYVQDQGLYAQAILKLRDILSADETGLAQDSVERWLSDSEERNKIGEQSSSFLSTNFLTNLKNLGLRTVYLDKKGVVFVPLSPYNSDKGKIPLRLPEAEFAKMINKGPYVDGRLPGQSFFNNTKIKEEVANDLRTLFPFGGLPASSPVNEHVLDVLSKLLQYQREAVLVSYLSANRVVLDFGNTAVSPQMDVRVDEENENKTIITINTSTLRGMTLSVEDPSHYYVDLAQTWWGLQSILTEIVMMAAKEGDDKLPSQFFSQNSFGSGRGVSSAIGKLGEKGKFGEMASSPVIGENQLLEQILTQPRDNIRINRFPGGVVVEIRGVEATPILLIGAQIDKLTDYTIVETRPVRVVSHFSTAGLPQSDWRASVREQVKKRREETVATQSLKERNLALAQSLLANTQTVKSRDSVNHLYRETIFEGHERIFPRLFEQYDTQRDWTIKRLSTIFGIIAEIQEKGNTVGKEEWQDVIKAMVNTRTMAVSSAVTMRAVLDDLLAKEKLQFEPVLGAEGVSSEHWKGFVFKDAQGAASRHTYLPRNDKGEGNRTIHMFMLGESVEVVSEVGNTLGTVESDMPAILQRIKARMDRVQTANETPISPVEMLTIIEDLLKLSSVALVPDQGNVADSKAFQFGDLKTASLLARLTQSGDTEIIFKVGLAEEKITIKGNVLESITGKLNDVLQQVKRQVEQKDKLIPRIILVDDDIGVREFLTEEFTANGFPVLSTADGEAALATYNELIANGYRIRAVITDQNMPKKKGLVLAAELIAQGFPSEQIVVQTTQELAEVKKEMPSNLPATQLVHKGGDIDEYYSLLDRALGGVLLQRLPTSSPVTGDFFLAIVSEARTLAERFREQTLAKATRNGTVHGKYPIFSDKYGLLEEEYLLGIWPEQEKGQTKVTLQPAKHSDWFASVAVPLEQLNGTPVQTALDALLAKGNYIPLVEPQLRPPKDYRPSQLLSVLEEDLLKPEAGSEILLDRSPKLLEGYPQQLDVRKIFTKDEESDIKFRRVKLSLELRKAEATGKLETKIVLWKGIIRLGSVTVPGVWTSPAADWKEAAALMVAELNKRAAVDASSPVGNVANGHIERARETLTNLGPYLREEKAERRDLLAGPTQVRTLYFQGGIIRMTSGLNDRVELSLFKSYAEPDLVRSSIAGSMTMNPAEAAQALQSLLADTDSQVKNASSPVTAGIKNPGGINLDPALLHLQIKRDQNWVPLPIPQQPPLENMNIEGFYPVIINVTPVPSLPMLLGRDADNPLPAAGAGKPRPDLSYKPLLNPLEPKGIYRLTRRAIER